MKKMILLLSIAVSALSANAQLYLSGTGPYTQSFNAISSSLPSGWFGYTDAGPSAMGSVWSYNGSASFGVYDTTNAGCVGAVNAAGFKNFASATVAGASDTCSVQQGYTDRAFGVRQAKNTATSANGHFFDSGAAFVFRLANTSGMTGVNVGFRLQSLDTTSTRIVKWKLQYGVGSNPTTFTDVATTPSLLTTGGGLWKNDSVTASFGTGLDNITSGNVIIRLVTLDYSSGSGNRPSTAIDNFSMSWTGSATMGIADVNGNPIAGLTVLGNATTDNITFGYDVAGNNNTLSIYDLAGRKVYTQVVDASNTEVSVNGLHLAPGMYVAKIGNNQAEAVAKVMVN